MNIKYKIPALLLLPLLTACSLEPPGSDVTVELDFSQYGDAGSNAAFINPSQTSLLSNWGLPAGVNCVAVNIMGQDIPSVDEQDYNHSVFDELISDPNTSCAYPGILSNLLPLSFSGKVELVVPAGTKRIFHLVGVESLIGCPSDKPFGQYIVEENNDGDFFGDVIELGRKTMDLFADAEVAIPKSFDANNIKDVKCKDTGGSQTTYQYYLYAASADANRELHVFTINQSTGGLTATQTLNTSGIDVGALAVDPDGQRLYVAQTTGANPVLNMYTLSQGLIQAGVTASSSTYVGTYRDVVAHSDGTHVYVLGDNSGAQLLKYDVNPTTGTFVSGAPTSIGADSVTSVARLAISSDGSDIFTTSYNDYILQFPVSNVGVPSAYTAAATSPCIDPTRVLYDETHGLVYASETTKICSLPINGSGTITATGIQNETIGADFSQTISTIHGIALHPQGTTLYVLAYFSGTYKIYSYSVNTTTGVLTGLGTPVSLGSLTGNEMMISPNGKSLYVAATNAGFGRIIQVPISSSTGEALSATTEVVPVGAAPNGIVRLAIGRIEL